MAELHAGGSEPKPGIFHVFQPTRIEKILADDASPEEVEAWEKKGCKVVRLPANDKDHQGTVYDDEKEETATVIDPPPASKRSSDLLV